MHLQMHKWEWSSTSTRMQHQIHTLSISSVYWHCIFFQIAEIFWGFMQALNITFLAITLLVIAFNRLSFKHYPFVCLQHSFYWLASIYSKVGVWFPRGNPSRQTDTKITKETDLNHLNFLLHSLFCST